MFNSKFLISLLAASIICSLLLSNAFADVSFGQGYTCSGKQILNPKGKVQNFSKFKTKANAKIDALKSALFIAKKRKQTSKVLLLTNNLNTQKVLLQNAKLCSKGSLLESPATTPTATPEKERPEPGDKIRR